MSRDKSWQGLAICGQVGHSGEGMNDDRLWKITLSVVLPLGKSVKVLAFDSLKIKHIVPKKIMKT